MLRGRASGNSESLWKIILASFRGSVIVLHVMKTQFTVTAENLSKESFYNLCRLVEITGYCDPIGAAQELKARGETVTWNVLKDSVGNICLK